MVYGINFLGRTKCVPQQNTNIINNYYGSNGMPQIYGRHYQYGNNPNPYVFNQPPKEHSGGWGKLLLGLGAGYLLSNNNSLDKMKGLFQKVGDWFGKLFNANNNSQ